VKDAFGDWIQWVHPVVLNLGMLSIRYHLEREEVAKVHAGRGLQVGEDVVGRPGEAGDQRSNHFDPFLGGA